MSQLFITVGGVRVAPFGGDGVGGFSNSVANLSSPVLAHLDGTLASPSDIRYSAAQTLLLCIPPGLGTVDVTVWIGSRNATAQLAYSSPQIAVSNSTPPGTNELLALRVNNFPACAYCFSSLGTAKCSMLQKQSSLPYTCPYLAIQSLSDCALPSYLWLWSSDSTCHRRGGLVPHSEALAPMCSNRSLAGNAALSPFSVQVYVTLPNQPPQDFISKNNTSINMNYFKTKYGTIVNENNVVIPMEEGNPLYIDYIEYLTNEGEVFETDLVNSFDNIYLIQDALEIDLYYTGLISDLLRKHIEKLSIDLVPIPQAAIDERDRLRAECNQKILDLGITNFSYRQQNIKL
jgi:hypothetical protein